MRYLEFAVASNFSFLRGASHPEELVVQAVNIGLAGIGLCDRNSVAGVVRAHLAKREQNLSLRYHPGARLVFADGTPDVLVYPRNRAGWGRLTRLLTTGNLRAEKGSCMLHLEDLLAHASELELIAMGGDAELLARLREAAPHRVRLAASMLRNPASYLLVETPSDLAQLRADGVDPGPRFAILGGAGIDPQEFAALPPAGNATPVVAFVGSMTKGNGVDVLMQACDRVAGRGTALAVELQ